MTAQRIEYVKVTHHAHRLTRKSSVSGQAAAGAKPRGF
jgi:hypothetical protein